MIYKKLLDSPSDRFFFTGYFDRNIVNINNNYVLCHQVDFLNREPNCDDSVSIGYFDISQSTYTEVCRTYAWSWQVGAGLEWLDGRKFIYNTVVNKNNKPKIVAAVYDVFSKKVSISNHPVYCVSSSGKKYLSVDAISFSGRDGYDFKILSSDDVSNSSIPVSLVDSKDFSSEPLFSVSDVLSAYQNSVCQKGRHYIDHLKFSDNDSKILFVHRWITENGEIFSNLAIYDLQEKQISIIYPGGRTTHSCWLSNDKILSWRGSSSRINLLRQSGFSFISYLYRILIPIKALFPISIVKKAVGDALYLHDLNADTVMIVKNISVDGHPVGMHSVTNKFLIDTYEDNEGFRSLILADVDSESNLLIDKIVSDPISDNKSYRCDLHPKLSKDDKFIVIDHSENGGRGFRIYEKVSN